MRMLSTMLAVLASGCAAGGAGGPQVNLAPVAKTWEGHEATHMIRAFGAPTAVESNAEQREVLQIDPNHLPDKAIWYYENYSRAAQQAKWDAERADIQQELSSEVECNGTTSSSGSYSAHSYGSHTSGTVRTNGAVNVRCEPANSDYVHGQLQGHDVGRGLAEVFNAHRWCRVEASVVDGIVKSVAVQGNGCKLSEEAARVRASPSWGASENVATSK